MTSWSDWIVGALIGALVLAGLGLWMAGRFAKVKRGKPSQMIPAGDETDYDALLEPLELRGIATTVANDLYGHFSGSPFELTEAEWDRYPG